MRRRERVVNWSGELNTKKLILALAVVFVLFWFWPNFVHEPLHYAATFLTPVDRPQIAFDLYHIPATPTISYQVSTENVTYIEYWFFLMLPSLFSILILAILSLTDTANIITDVSLPIYLAFDLIFNIWKVLPTSDFIWLHVLPFATILRAGCVGIVVVWLGVILMRADDVLIKNYI